MKRSRGVPVIAALACAGALVAGCTDDSPAGGPTAARSAAAAAAAEYARTLQIYTAAIRQLVTVERGGRRGPGGHIWLVDAAVAQSSGARLPADSVERFSDRLQADLLRALADLPSVGFVPAATAARDIYEGDQLAADSGAVVSVGRIEGDGNEVHMAYYYRCGKKCAEASTYIVERRGDDWAVTGKTGMSMVS